MFKEKLSNLLPWIGAVIVVTLLLIGSYVMMVGRKNSTEAPAPTTQESNDTVATASVEIASTGFSPSTIKVQKGTTVTWTNNDTKGHWVASDPYPTNDGLEGFDGKETIENGEAYSFNFSQTGTFTYHDQQNPYTFKGTVIVE